MRPWPRGCDVLIFKIFLSKFWKEFFGRKKMGGILPNSFQILLLSFTLNTLHITNKGSSISFCHHLKVFIKLVGMLFFHKKISQLFMCNGGCLQDGEGSKSSQLMENYAWMSLSQHQFLNASSL